MRELDSFERSLLLDAFERPIAVGGVLDETLEMLCNSFELLEREYLPGYVLGAWVITEKGKQLIKNHKGRFEDAANAELSELGKESPEVSALKDRIAALEGRRKRSEAKEGIQVRGFERLMKIARHWRGFAMRQGSEIASLKAQNEGGYQEFKTVLERLQGVRAQRDALIAAGTRMRIVECRKCEYPALMLSDAGAYCLHCRKEMATPESEPRTAA
jgi:hypothetical protein